MEINIQCYFLLVCSFCSWFRLFFIEDFGSESSKSYRCRIVNLKLMERVFIYLQPARVISMGIWRNNFSCPNSLIFFLRMRLIFYASDVRLKLVGWIHYKTHMFAVMLECYWTHFNSLKIKFFFRLFSGHNLR